VKPVPVSKVHSEMAFRSEPYTVASAGVKVVDGGKVGEEVVGWCGRAAARAEGEQSGRVSVIFTDFASF